MIVNLGSSYPKYQQETCSNTHTHTEKKKKDEDGQTGNVRNVQQLRRTSTRQCTKRHRTRGHLLWPPQVKVPNDLRGCSMFPPKQKKSDVLTNESKFRRKKKKKKKLYARLNGRLLTGSP